MDDSVMHKYTTVSTKAKHFVQYDQGKTVQHLSSSDISVKLAQIEEGDGDLSGGGGQREGGKLVEN